ncbi:MAG: hypothetical protein ACSLE4_02765 [Methyloceanibacter sp.]|uniref:hypothetical protein n=1 Tax=Methyloceanibacter sp. TaxID=1965321 RepID=UPI003EE21C79
MDEVEKIISRLNGVDPERPYFDPLAVEEAVRRHARLIGFRDVSFTWAMGPRQANSELEGVDFESPEACRWPLTMQAMQDQAVAELQRDDAVWQAYQEAQRAAEERIAQALHLELFRLALFNLLSGEAGQQGHNVASLVSFALRDVIAGASVESEALEDLNDAYLPFADAIMAGLGSFWIVGERFVCLPLPRLALENGALVSDGSPAAIWPNGEAYANGDEGLIPVLQSVEW